MTETIRAGRGAAVAALVLAVSVSVTATASDQTDPGPYPKFKDGVVEPPKEAVTGAPFDVAKLFDTPPRDRNAAPVYLDALAEFAPEAVNASAPEGPERDRRRKLVAARARRASDLSEGFNKAPKSVTGAAIDAVVAEHREGFRKLAKAQKFDRCVFQTGVGVTALMPHVQAARQVARVAALKARRELDRGDIDAAIGDVRMTLRLARDLQPRGYLISQLVTAAMRSVVAKQMVEPILAAPGLRPEHCDRLLAALTDHEARSVDAYTEALKAEYVSTRVTLLDLIRHQDQLARTMGLKPGDSVIKNLFHVTTLESGRDGGKPEAKTAPGGPSFPDDVDARVARTTPAELNRVVEELNAYYAALLALGGRPTLEQLARTPDVTTVIGGDTVLGQLARELQPTVPNVVQALGRTGATVHAAECLTAVRRWQLTHQGASPADLAAACQAAGLKAVPADPYDCQPMRLAVLDGAPVVYSIGKDGRDDGGRVDSDDERRPGDQLHRLPRPTTPR